MKIKHYLLSTILAFSLAFSFIIYANDSPFYYGVKAGVMSLDNTGAGAGVSIDDATNVAFVIGYKLSKIGNGNLAIEGEISTTVAGGDVNIIGFTGDWDIDTLAVYAVYRSSGNIYFKGKAGILYEDVGFSIVGISDSGSDEGFSAGIGMGWKMGKSNALEVEYTVIEEDIDYISVGYNFRF